MAKRSPAPENRPLDASCRIAVFYGKEAFLRLEFTSQLRDALAAAHGEVDTMHFDGATAKAADVLDECRSFGLLATHKMVVVDNADQVVKDPNRGLFERYAESPTDSATLVLRAERWYPGTLDKLVAQVGAVIKCDEIREDQAVNWAVKRCEKRQGTLLDRDAAMLLVERLGVDLTHLDSEIAKLATFAGAGARVTRQLVAEMVGQSREEAVWDIQYDLLASDPARAMQSLRYALDVSRHPTVLISWAMMDLARKLFAVSAGLRAGVPAGVLAKDLKLWGASQGLIESKARQLDPHAAADLLHAAVEGDAKQKSSIGEPEQILERLALKFAGLPC